MKNRATWSDGNSHGARLIHLSRDKSMHVGIVSDMTMTANLVPMRSRNEAHASAFERGRIQRHPTSKRLVLERRIPIGLILMPWERLAHLRRFANHVAPSPDLCALHTQQSRGNRLPIAPESGSPQFGKARLGRQNLRLEILTRAVIGT